MKTSELKILIVGAGPTGLTAAIELARNGIMPTIIEKRKQASKLSRAVGITPKSLEIFSKSGVDTQLIEQGIAITNNHIFLNDQLSLSIPLNSETSYFQTLIGLPQDQTETLLIEQFKKYGGRVNYGIELINLHQGDTNQDHSLGQLIQVQLSEAIDSGHVFNYVFGADGIYSQVRQACNIPYLGYDLNETWSIADVNINNWPYPSDFCLFKLSAGQMAVVVAIGEQRYRVISNTNNSLKALPLKVDVTHIHREGTFNISVRQAESYAKGNVFLGGDAAHCHSPVGGRGMNLGIGDAALWAQFLLEDRLTEYADIRHLEGKKTMQMTERGRRMIEAQSWYRVMFFKLFLNIANRSNWIKKRISKFITEF